MLGNIEMHGDMQMAIQLGLKNKDKDKRSQISHFYITYQIERGRNKTSKQMNIE